MLYSNQNTLCEVFVDYHISAQEKKDFISGVSLFSHAVWQKLLFIWPEFVQSKKNIWERDGDKAATGEKMNDGEGNSISWRHIYDISLEAFLPPSLSPSSSSPGKKQVISHKKSQRIMQDVSDILCASTQPPTVACKM